ncbi:glycogen debranching N-terminal domain-containing protein [Nitrospirillum sp. BR 11828]|nr:glycogen debranching N-terminal domain-containing protein [Nitrospirillum sp. BR 11828]MDZ5650769.1 glycogen debranching N-terminal domain-containing protein [Nitrospirillum sp. BR 11828]
MAALDERQLDPAIGLAGPDGSGPRETFRLFALKHGDCFVVADAHGDIQGQGDGLFVDDTRILSRYQLRIGDKEPSLLGASLSEDNILFTANSTNVPMPAPGGGMTLWGVIHIERTRILWQNRMYERVTLSNFGGSDIVVPLTLNFTADFRDMFEVRGSTRQLRGRTHEAQLSGDGVTLSYEGLDHVTRQATLSFSQAPDRLQGDRAVFNVNLPTRGGHVLYIEVGTERTATPSRVRFRAAAVRARLEMRTKRRRGASVYSSGRVFNDWLARAQADTALLTTELATGPYPYAGIPWFSTAFGRDGIISALQMMWLNPRLARGVLAFLATHQATETAPFSDAQPGKILHETRKGEMAVLRELPFGRYYGSVDTTPLYIYLASVYADRTGDMAFIDQLWPSLCAAAAWMEGAGDQNGDGFVDYQRAEESGLANQGWKDSFDSIQHADGSLPEGPIALVEVQGYVYAAYRGLARLATRRGRTRRPPIGSTGRRPCARRWKPISGWRIWAFTPWRWMARAGPAACARPMSAICCSWVCPHPNGRSAWPISCWPAPSIPAGASARWRIPRSVSTPCPITTGPSGRTTPPSAPPAWRAMVCAAAWSS